MVMYTDLMLTYLVLR